MLQSFLDVTLPPFLLFIGVAAVVVFGGIITIGRLRLYSIQRKRIIDNRKALTAAKDALASIISETMDGDKVRTFATTAYEKLNSINTKEMERE